MTNLDRQLAELREGRATFAVFVRGTRREFERMATYLRRRWAPPSWYEHEEVVQELYLGAWLHVPRWDPLRGPSLSRYVVYTAMSKAKRGLHKARGAKKDRADHQPSRFEPPVSSLGRQDGSGEALVDALLAEAASAETSLIAAEERREAVSRATRACARAVERFVVRAIARSGDLDAAAAIVYDDIDARIALHLGSEDIARRKVRSEARKIAARVGASQSSARTS